MRYKLLTETFSYQDIAVIDSIHELEYDTLPYTEYEANVITNIGYIESKAYGEDLVKVLAIHSTPDKELGTTKFLNVAVAETCPLFNIDILFKIMNRTNLNYNTTWYQMHNQF